MGIGHDSISDISPSGIVQADQPANDGEVGAKKEQEDAKFNGVCVSPGVYASRSFSQETGIVEQYEETDPRAITGIPRIEDTGVLMTGAVDNLAEYNGVALPYSYFNYLRKASLIARERGVSFNVVVHGLGRVISKFGVERVFNVISKGNKDEEVVAMLNKIREIETIRAAISEACARVCGYDNFGEALSITGRVISDKQHVGKRIVGTIKNVHDGFGHRIPLTGGSSRDSFGLSETADFGGLSVNACLCKGKRDLYTSKKISRDDALQMSLYPYTEAAVADWVVNSRNMQYLAPVGSDCPEELNKKLKMGDYTIAQWLRKLFLIWLSSSDKQRSKNKKSGRVDKLEKGWELSGDLDGDGIWPPKSRGASVSNAIVDPYYRGAANFDGSRQPLRIPGVPYERGWLQRNLANGGGVHLPGIDVVLARAVPVVKDWLNHADKKDDLRGVGFVTELNPSDLRNYACGPEFVLPPPQYSLPHLDVLLQQFAIRIAKETVNVLTEQEQNKINK